MNKCCQVCASIVFTSQPQLLWEIQTQGQLRTAVQLTIWDLNYLWLKLHASCFVLHLVFMHLVHGLSNDMAKDAKEPARICSEVGSFLCHYGS